MSVTADLGAQRRFVLYKLVPLPSGKSDKVPIDPATGYNISAQDESAWMLPGMALAWAASYGEGYGVGISLRDPAGLLFVDIDGCIASDGTLSILARKLVADFAGCYIEYSPSGNGLHIFGSYTGEPPTHSCKNGPLHIELYTSGRFMTTTGRTFQEGSVLHDATAPLWATAWSYFKPIKIEGANGEQGWTTEYDPRCTFTGTAEERIAALLKMKSFAAKINPKKVTFADLHNVNIDKLAATWPPNPDAKSGLPYDGSSVDQSYLNHLAYGFGDNCAAIEQYALSAECPLHRTKWDERPDYLRSTILKAVAIPKQWKRRNAASAERAAPAIPPALIAPRPPTFQAPQQVATPVGEHVAAQLPTTIPAPPDVPVPALPTMLANAKGLWDATLDYVRRQLESDGLLSFDTFRGEPMIQRGIMPTPMTDKDYIDLRTIFEREKSFAPVAKDCMRDAVLAEAQARQFDSAVEWLNAQVWDGVPRVDAFMITHFGAEDNEYTRAVGRYMWSGLAGRIYEPGCQLDMVIALQSRQGTGKSTGLKALAPDPTWFTDGLSLHEDDDNFKRLIRGKVIVEIAELAGLSKGDINVVKRTITRTTEEWIEKYQTTLTKYLRRCMLFASTNEQEFLPPDETGQRRWLPVVITEINRPLVAADRAQLWAEGAAIWKASGIAYADAERLAAGKHKAHEVTDLWVTRISEWLTVPSTSGEAPCTRALAISEVLEGAIHMQPSHMDAKAGQRAGRVLRQLGYASKNVKIDGRVVKRWVVEAPPAPPAPKFLP